jgi:hypothetical protein
MKASTFRRTFSDDEVALALAEQQELPSEQVGRAQQAVRVEHSISGAHAPWPSRRDTSLFDLATPARTSISWTRTPSSAGKLDERHLGRDGLQRACDGAGRIGSEQHLAASLAAAAASLPCTMVGHLVGQGALRRRAPASPLVVATTSSMASSGCSRTASSGYVPTIASSLCYEELSELVRRGALPGRATTAPRRT